MPEVIATIQSLESKTGEKNGRTWVMYNYTTSAGKFSTFDKKAFAELQPGKTFNLVYDESPNPKGGTFKNLKSWEKTDAPVVTVPAAQSTTTGRGDLDNRITWNSAVNNAVHLMQPMYANGNGKEFKSQLVDLAGQLYEIILGGPNSVNQESSVSIPNGATVVEIQTGVEEKSVNESPKRGRPAKKAGEAAKQETPTTSTDAMPSYELLKQLNDARFVDNSEKVTMLDIKGMLQSGYNGQNIRELDEAEIKELIERVRAMVKPDTSDLPF